MLITFVRYFSLFVSKILWQIEFHNTENIPKSLDTGLLITPNHQTYIDPFWVCIPIKKDLRLMAWDEAFGWFFIGRFISLLGAFPVSLKRGASIKALKESLKVLRDGKALLIFPEGEREFADGKLLPFKTGAVRIALEANVPILPVTIRGGNKIWSRDHKFPRFGKVEIFYHPIIRFSKDQPIEQVNSHLEEIVKSPNIF